VLRELDLRRQRQGLQACIEEALVDRGRVSDRPIGIRRVQDLGAEADQRASIVRLDRGQGPCSILAQQHALGDQVGDRIARRVLDLEGPPTDAEAPGRDALSGAVFVGLDDAALGVSEEAAKLDGRGGESLRVEGHRHDCCLLVRAHTLDQHRVRDESEMEAFAGRHHSESLMCVPD